jgi:hypothetical protein
MMVDTTKAASECPFVGDHHELLAVDIPYLKGKHTRHELPQDDDNL